MSRIAAIYDDRYYTQPLTAGQFHTFGTAAQHLLNTLLDVLNVTASVPTKAYIYSITESYSTVDDYAHKGRHVAPIRRHHSSSTKSCISITCKYSVLKKVNSHNRKQKKVQITSLYCRNSTNFPPLWGLSKV